jgi:4-aminobutyrate aminotransferase-like enzyme
VLLRTGIRGKGEPRAIGGHGAWLRLEDGREVIDAMTTPAPLGHRHPRVVEAVRRAAAGPTLDEGWATAEREAAAEEILGTAFAGEEWVGAVRFTLTGSEANDLALSLCQALTGRRPLVARERAYHGMVGLARDVTTQPQWHGGLAAASGPPRVVPPSAEVRVLPFRRGSLGDGLEMAPAEAEDVLEGADAALDAAAAVIMDYTQGGCYPAPAYQDVLARKARAAGSLWIADEVITGFGKCGRWFNFQRGAERPDIVTLGKPLGGGLMPVGGVVLSRQVCEEIGDASWQNYSALRSSDVGAAAARAFVRVIESEGLVERADRLHDVLADKLRGLASAHPGVRRIDGRGLHWWIELHGEADDIASRVAARVLEAGALIATSGEPDVLLITLPMIIEDAEIDTLFDALDLGLELVDREM